MIQKELSQLTNEELLLEGKKIRSGNIVNAVLFGVMIGVATWSTVKYGLGIITFFPLLFIQMLLKNNARKKAFETELKNRNLTL
ncbi:FUSC family protein [Kaistella carnis]|uniref:FUSC family protein n=1 Tax=Kaistella carnis TaxID=1241979 RepID=A0A3G8XLZ8_9FLAO|nr:FUSC family protein [Kaistella carnis]AZI32757.1 FUSC family protein [Kaistella carnis]